MRNAGLDEAQAGINIARWNINNLRYADDTTLMAEREEELKSLLKSLLNSELVQSFSRVWLFATRWKSKLSCFFDDPADVSNLISGSSALLKPAWTSGSSRFMYCWSLAWGILSITLLACEMSAIVW